MGASSLRRSHPRYADRSFLPACDLTRRLARAGYATTAELAAAVKSGALSARGFSNEDISELEAMLAKAKK